MGDEFDENGTESVEKEKSKKPKYIPEELPAVRGMERLKGTVNVNDCLAAFTDPELLEGDNKYRCKHCTRLDLEEKRKNGQLQHILAQCNGQQNEKESKEEDDLNGQESDDEDQSENEQSEDLENTE